MLKHYFYILLSLTIVSSYTLAMEKRSEKRRDNSHQAKKSTESSKSSRKRKSPPKKSISSIRDGSPKPSSNSRPVSRLVDALRSEPLKLSFKSRNDSQSSENQSNVATEANKQTDNEPVGQQIRTATTNVIEAVRTEQLKLKVKPKRSLNTLQSLEDENNASEVNVQTESNVNHSSQVEESREKDQTNRSKRRKISGNSDDNFEISGSEKEVPSEDNQQNDASVKYASEEQMQQDYEILSLMNDLIDVDEAILDKSWIEVFSKHQGDVIAKYFAWKSLSDQTLDLNARDDQGHTSVYHAVNTDNVSLLDNLARSGADVNIPDNEGRTPLYLTIIKQSLAILQCLTKHNLDVNQSIMDIPPLHLAIDASTDSTIDFISLLLNQGAEVNKPDTQGRSPLYFAIKQNPSIVRLLIEHNADVNEKSRGTTALHEAIRSFLDNTNPDKQVELINNVKLLIEANANLAVLDDNEEKPVTPLTLIIDSKNPTLIKLIRPRLPRNVASQS